jgi:TolB-like protein/DNA-binding SARP family transcriptional activator/Tfp pilus assembly protein PilF
MNSGAHASMLRLLLLGGAIIERGDGELLTGRAVQRHRMAILALLATAPAGGISRDKLLGLLWPESDTDRARNLLNVSLYEVRKALGEGTIVSSGDDLRLDRTLLTSDVGELEAAAAGGEHAVVVARYRGPFLDGLFLSGAPDFEKWLDGERSRLAAIAARSLEALAADAAERGNHVESVNWLRQRAAFDPLDARVALRLMQALEASGNRAAALQHARVHARLMESEIGLGPDSGVEAFAAALSQLPASSLAATLPDPTPPQGHTPAAAPEIEAPPQATSSSDQAVAAATLTAGTTVPSSRRPRRAVLATLLASVAALVTLAVAPWKAADRSVAAPRSIAVLPFVNLGADPNDGYLGDGLTEELTARLSSDSTLRVVSRTSSSRYQKTSQTVPEIARALDVTAVLEGSVRRVGSRLRVTAQLIDARNDRHLWSATYDRELGDVLALQDQLAREVTRALEPVLGRPANGIALRGTRDAEAHDLYLRGRWHWKRRTPEGHALAIDFFRQSIARDSSYADAYAGLSDAVFTAYVLGHEPWASDETGTIATMRTASERAIMLEPASSAAHTSLAIVRWAETDLPAAERLLQRAIDLNSGNVFAHSWYGRMLHITGHPLESMLQSREAWKREPFDLTASHNYAVELEAADSVQASRRLYERTLDLDSTFYISRVGYAILLVNSGDTVHGAERLVRVAGTAKPSAQALVNLAWALALLGRADSATRVLNTVKSRLTASSAPRHAFEIARAYTALQQRDSAFAWLDRADWRWPPWGNVYATELSSLRSDPRYSILTRRVGRRLHAGATRHGWAEVRPRRSLVSRR